MKEQAQRFLDSVYDLSNSDDTQDYYRKWASTYDEEVQGEGYITPQRCAQALAEAAGDQSQPVLDIGCGSGLSGVALQEAGFKVIDGVDISTEMLELARARNIYRRTVQHDLSLPLPIEEGRVGNIAAVGIFSPGHAPHTTIDHAINVLPSGGVLVFSLNDHAMAIPAYEGRVHAHIDSGSVELVSREYGAHMPGINLQAVVYALRKR